MKVMAQIFQKEVQDFEQEQAPIINCMTTIDRREECLAEILQLNAKLDAASEEEQN